MVKIRVYALTRLGRRIVSTKTGSDDEMRLLRYLHENRTATDDELSVAIGGGNYLVKRLVSRGLVTELTKV